MLAAIDTDWLLHTPERELPLWAALDAAASGAGTVTVGEESRTWAQLRDRAARLAGGLRRIGVGPGDRIATIMTDRAASLEVVFAAAALGAIWAPLGPFLRGRFLEHQLRAADPKLLLVDGPGAVESARFVDELPQLAAVLMLDELDGHYSDDRVEPAGDGRLAAAILFTSGTTGLPKGCVVSQGYFVKAAACYCLSLGISDADVVFTSFPLFHGAALCVAMTTIVAGGTLHHPGAFGASTYMADLAAASATVTIGTGGMAAALLAQPASDADRAHALRVAEWVPLSAAAQKRFAERFGVVVYGEHYGQTECMTATQTRLSEARDPGSAGRASPLVELAVLDADGHRLAPGDVGEIALRPRTSGAMFSGYWRAPEATAESRSGLWHHTGDAGRLSPDGVLTFVDRRSDSLRRRGENVSSLELEAAILEHPEIAEAAVHAVPSEMTEDDIKACIVSAPGAELQPGPLFEFLARSLPYYAVPRYVEVMGELPRTPNQKVRKHELRARGITPQTWDLEALGLVVDREARRVSAR